LFMILLIAACGSSSSTSDGGAGPDGSSNAGVPPPGRIFATFTFDSPSGYTGSIETMTNEPTYVVSGTTLTNGGVSIQYGDENHMPTRVFLIPLYTNTPLSDGLLIPLVAHQFSYTENNAMPDSADWRNDGSRGVVVGHVDGQTFTFTLHTPMTPSSGATGTFMLDVTGVITLCATDPLCFSNNAH